VLDFLQNHDPVTSKPFFLWLGLVAPHPPYGRRGEAQCPCGLALCRARPACLVGHVWGFPRWGRTTVPDVYLCAPWFARGRRCRYQRDVGVVPEHVCLQRCTGCGAP
jgi:hypothetical protein